MRANTHLGRDAFIQLASHLINDRGTITSEGDLEIIAGGMVRNLSGVLESEGDLSITAGHIENRTLVYRYDLAGTQGQYFGEIGSFIGDNFVLIQTESDNPAYRI